jgi:hypothetical protein
MNMRGTVPILGSRRSDTLRTAGRKHGPVPFCFESAFLLPMVQVDGRAQPWSNRQKKATANPLRPPWSRCKITVRERGCATHGNGSLAAAPPGGHYVR